MEGQQSEGTLLTAADVKQQLQELNGQPWREKHLRFEANALCGIRIDEVDWHYVTICAGTVSGLDIGKGTIKNLRCNNVSITTSSFHSTNIEFAQHRHSTCEFYKSAFCGASFQIGSKDRVTFRQCHNFVKTNFGQCDLTNCQFLICDLSLSRFGTQRHGYACATIGPCLFDRVKGLWGPKGAVLETIEEAEQARFGKRLPILWSWRALKAVGTNEFMSFSYVTLVVLLVYASAISWYNQTLAPAAETILQSAREQLEPPSNATAVSPSLHISASPWLTFLLMAVLFVAIGTTIFRLSCPGIVRQYTRDEWVYGLKESVLAWDGASYDRWIARRIACFFQYVGGLYILGYVSWRVVRSVWIFWVA